MRLEKAWKLLIDALIELRNVENKVNTAVVLARIEDVELKDWNYTEAFVEHLDKIEEMIEKLEQEIEKRKKVSKNDSEQHW